MLQETWESYRNDGQWPELRELYSKHNKRKVKAALTGTPLTSNVGGETQGGGRRYSLSLLGVLLTKEGPKMQMLLQQYFQFQRHFFRTKPTEERFSGEDVAKMFKLKSDETMLLGELLGLGHHNVGRRVDGTWEGHRMQEAEDFPESGDLLAEVEKWVCIYYIHNIDKPVFAEDHRVDNVGPLAENLLPVQVVPAAIHDSLARFRVVHKTPKKRCFIMMRFGKTQTHSRIEKAIKTTLEKHGLVGFLACDREFDDDLFSNILTYVYGCDFGIAIFERLLTDEFNPNVALEVGYMLGLRKPVMLLKDQTLKALHTDLVGKLYKEFDPQRPQETIPRQIETWLTDKGLA